MATRVIQESRLKHLNDKPVQGGSYVLYWMQASQRAELNHALEYAVQRANDLNKPLLVGFGLTDDYPEANARHYRFMLEGLREVSAALGRRGIAFVLRLGSPEQVALALAEDAALIVADRGYLRHQKQWRAVVADAAPCRMTQGETDVVVPVELASDKAEYAARTLRPKLHKRLDDYLVDLRTTPLQVHARDLEVSGRDPNDIDSLMSELKLDDSVAPVGMFEGGTSQARAILRSFIAQAFEDYREHRNQPQTDDVSHMSKYLHFGQISPLYIALEIQAASVSQGNIDSYLEELIVRRELPMNFVHYTDNYDSFACLPDWAKKTLDEHRGDEREVVYNEETLENAESHDPYWNAAMKEMRFTGYMHNYMRMYWGKKILEWSASPEEAYATALYLNNKYFLDGRDPNSFANIAWLFGLHDRPWTERPIFGKVRYMNARGLERKAKPQAYVEKVERLMA